MKPYRLSSGEISAVPANSPQEANGKPGIKEGASEHNRTNNYNKRSSILDILLGSLPRMVRASIKCYCNG